MLNVYFAVLRNSELPSGSNLSVVINTFDYDGINEVPKESRVFIYSGRWNRQYEIPSNVNDYQSAIALGSLLRRHQSTFSSDKTSVDAYDSEAEFSNEIHAYLKDLIDETRGQSVYFLWYGRVKEQLVMFNDELVVANFYTQMYWLRQILIRGGNHYVFRFGKSIYSVNLSEFTDVKDFENSKGEIGFPEVGNRYSGSYKRTHVCFDTSKSGFLFGSYSKQSDIPPTIYYYSTKDLPYKLKQTVSVTNAPQLNIQLDQYFAWLKTLKMEDCIYNIQFSDVGKLKINSKHQLNQSDLYENQLKMSRLKLALNSLNDEQLESVSSLSAINKKLNESRELWKKDHSVYSTAFEQLGGIEPLLGAALTKSIKL